MTTAYRHTDPFRRMLRQRPAPADIPEQARALVAAYKAREGAPTVTLYPDAGHQSIACLACTLAESDGAVAGTGLEPSRLVRQAAKGARLTVHQRAAVRAEAGSILRLCGWSVEWRTAAELDQ